MTRDVWSALMGLVTLTFDRLTSELVCQSHLRLGTFLPNLDYMYVTGGRTDENQSVSLFNTYILYRDTLHNSEFIRWKAKATLTAPYLRAGVLQLHHAKT